MCGYFLFVCCCFFAQCTSTPNPLLLSGDLKYVKHDWGRELPECVRHTAQVSSDLATSSQLHQGFVIQDLAT